MAKKMTFAPGMTMNGTMNRPNDAIVTKKAENAYNIKFISIDDIIPNEKNARYPQIDIESLSASIESRGLLHNLDVKPIEDKKYKLISGEGRWRAISLLKSNNEERFSELFPGGLLPCKIQNSANEIDEEIDLIIANHETRAIDAKERLSDITQLAMLYRMKNENGESPSTNALSETIAKQLEISARQIHKYLSLDKLIPELYEAFENDLLSINIASKIATLGETEQLFLYDILKEEGKISEDDILASKVVTEKKIKADEDLKKTQDEIEALHNIQKDAKADMKKTIDKKIKEKEDSAKDVKETLSPKELKHLRKVAKANRSLETIEVSIAKLEKLMKDVGEDAEIRVKIELLEDRIKALI